MTKGRKMEAANMTGVPNEELLLAEAIANSVAAGVSFRRYTLGVSPDSTGVYQPGPGDECCAIGALLIGRRGPDLSNVIDEDVENMMIVDAVGSDDLVVGDVYNGNDGPEEEWDTRSQGIGIGYRCFHTVDEE